MPLLQDFLSALTDPVGVFRKRYEEHDVTTQREKKRTKKLDQILSDRRANSNDTKEVDLQFKQFDKAAEKGEKIAEFNGSTTLRDDLRKAAVALAEKELKKEGEKHGDKEVKKRADDIVKIERDDIKNKLIRDRKADRDAAGTPAADKGLPMDVSDYYKLKIQTLNDKMAIENLMGKGPDMPKFPVATVEINDGPGHFNGRTTDNVILRG